MVAFLPLLWIAGAGVALATSLTISNQGRDNGCNPFRPDPNACWSETGDLDQSALASQILDNGGTVYEAEVANDFVFHKDSEIALARWWSEVV
jgi:hypothetical protein